MDIISPDPIDPTSKSIMVVDHLPLDETLLRMDSSTTDLLSFLFTNSTSDIKTSERFSPINAAVVEYEYEVLATIQKQEQQQEQKLKTTTGPILRSSPSTTTIVSNDGQYLTEHNVSSSNSFFSVIGDHGRVVLLDTQNEGKQQQNRHDQELDVPPEAEPWWSLPLVDPENNSIAFDAEYLPQMVPSAPGCIPSHLLAPPEKNSDADIVDDSTTNPLQEVDAKLSSDPADFSQANSQPQSCPSVDTTNDASSPLRLGYSGRSGRHQQHDRNGGGEADGKKGVRRFRALNSGQWFQRYRELTRFLQTHGHCNVPHNWPQSVGLALWVKRQRYQFKLKREGKHSNLTEERKESLDRLGFVWSSQDEMQWEERVRELRTFRAQYGHAKVPSDIGRASGSGISDSVSSSYSSNGDGEIDRKYRGLCAWANRQRQQYWFYFNGYRVMSTMTKQRIEELEQLGFMWDHEATDAAMKSR